MIEYIKNVIPRIQQYSKGLNKIELLVEPKKPWIHYDEKGNQHQYIFMRDGRLFMIFNGVTKTGKWELLHTNQLLIDRISDQITLEHIFVEKALLILKLSGTTHQPFILINPLEIPDLDVEGYLEKFEREKETISIPQADIKYKILKSGKISGPLFYKGLKILTDNGDILSGTYNTTCHHSTQFVEIKNNLIVRLYYKISYTYNGQTFQIEQADFDTPKNGDKLTGNIDFKQFLVSHISVKNSSNIMFGIKCSVDGIIIDVIDEDNSEVILTVTALTFIFIVILISASSC